MTSFLAVYLIFVLAVVPLWFVYRRQAFIARHAAVSAILAFSIGELIKNLFFVPRPFISLQHLPSIDLIMDGSFPSNHSAVSFAIAFSVFLHNKSAGKILLILAGFVALGRVLSGVHTPFDVLAGAILGFTTSRLIFSYFTR